MAKKDSATFSDRIRNVSNALELDPRLLSMIGALMVIWIFFYYASDGIFLSPRNLWNLSVQTSVTALIATGMVLIIVSRNIDLSVGSLLAFLGIMGGFVQTELLTFEGTHSWWISIVVMILAGAILGGLQGY
ncbi:MAG: sugar ABC transporter permease, partial [Hyphomicrobiales bacterium]